MKSKKFIFLAIILVFLVVVLVFIFIQKNQKTVLPEDLYSKFECGRVTLDDKPTDVYCGDYDLYKKDKAAGLVE